jgi:hypothetical protein
MPSDLDGLGTRGDQSTQRGLLPGCRAANFGPVTTGLFALAVHQTEHL